jgi:hypothetical protein
MPARAEGSVYALKPGIAFNGYLTIAINGLIIQESEFDFIFFGRRNKGGTL